MQKEQQVVETEILTTGKQTCGMYLNIGVKNSREHPMMIPVISPDKPVLASLSLFTADLEKDPKFCIQDTDYVI